MKGRHAETLYNALLKYDNHHIMKGQAHSLVHQPAEYNILHSFHFSFFSLCFVVLKTKEG